MAQLARFADPAMLKVDNLNYASQATVFFQVGLLSWLAPLPRSSTLHALYNVLSNELSCLTPFKTPISSQRGSVIATDAVLIGAAWYATARIAEPRRSAAFLLIVCSAGLLIVDHIHFQYNGLLLGARHSPPCDSCDPGGGICPGL